MRTKISVLFQRQIQPEFILDCGAGFGESTRASQKSSQSLSPKIDCGVHWLSLLFVLTLAQRTFSAYSYFLSSQNPNFLRLTCTHYVDAVLRSLKTYYLYIVIHLFCGLNHQIKSEERNANDQSGSRFMIQNRADHCTLKEET